MFKDKDMADIYMDALKILTAIALLSILLLILPKTPTESVSVDHSVNCITLNSVEGSANPKQYTDTLLLEGADMALLSSMTDVVGVMAKTAPVPINVEDVASYSIKTGRCTGHGWFK